ncbi:MAG: hypothetical protein KKB59_07205, partial [Spirochaetes bacterium]|nr:hypothetical protein [Spirochaetota bacterium]
MPRLIRIRLALVAVASIALSGATSTYPFDPLGDVPAGAIAVVTVGDPATLFVNAVGFLRNAGLEEPAAALEA